jgi:hypothetical protein
MNIDIKSLKTFISKQEKDFLFITLSGAHIYGFSSPDSDYDLRGAHIFPLNELFTLKKIEKTFELSTIYEEKEVDMVSHEIEKYFSFVARGNNGYVMEQIFSPIVIYETPYFHELKNLSSKFICKLLYHHYRGFAGNQMKIIEKQEEPKAKSFLYLYRVLMTGINVLKHGIIETDITKLNKDFNFEFIPELIERKIKEKSKIKKEETEFYIKKVEFMEKEMEKAYNESKLPNYPDSKDFEKLDNLLFEIRMYTIKRVML